MRVKIHSENTVEVSKGHTLALNDRLVDYNTVRIDNNISLKITGKGSGFNWYDEEIAKDCEIIMTPEEICDLCRFALEEGLIQFPRKGATVQEQNDYHFALSVSLTPKPVSK